MRTTVVEWLDRKSVRRRRDDEGLDSSAAEPIFEDAPVVERPLRRPPMAVLCALDDGQLDEGETWRVRRSRHVIGRKSGETIIPHDSEISSRHAAILRQEYGNGYRWWLRDLRSTNGTFLRVERSLLRHGSEVWLGSRRYRFLGRGILVPGGDAEDTEDEAGVGQTRRFARRSHPAGRILSPRLVEVRGEELGREWTIEGSEFWIGGGGRCTMVPEDDPFLGCRHARISRDRRGRWIIENANSLNGVWIRIEKTILDCDSEFRLGEQRFRIRFP